MLRRRVKLSSLDVSRRTLSHVMARSEWRVYMPEFRMASSREGSVAVSVCLMPAKNECCVVEFSDSAAMSSWRTRPDGVDDPVG